MSKKLCLGFLLSLLCFVGYSQVSYYGKVETGYSLYIFRSIQIDPGPNWQGYYLNAGQNGLELNLINGLELGNSLGFEGGIGYLNYQGINGVAIFGGIEILQKENKLSPIANLRIGYNHIWNHYSNGSGGVVVELGAGGCISVSDHISVYIQAGISGRLQAVFFPMKVGIRF